MPPPQFFHHGAPQQPHKSHVDREVEAKDPYALEAPGAPRPWGAPGEGEGEKDQDGGPDQGPRPQGEEGMGAQQKGEMGQAEGVHRADVQADAEQRDEGAHFRHHAGPEGGGRKTSMELTKLYMFIHA